LLILDNFEQLVEAGGGAIVETLLARLPSLTCLVTSRRVLGVVGEQEFPLSPLPLPGLSDSLAEIASNPGIALFVRRAQAVRPGFHLTEQNHTDVLALCRSLEGIPLALELAASRIRTLSPAEMQQQIQDRFDWLARSGPGADKEPRQRSLSATLEWSWRLLSPAHQRFLSALSVFRGGWNAEAAADVCAREDARDLLESLVMDSLRQRRDIGGNDALPHAGNGRRIRAQTSRRTNSLCALAAASGGFLCPRRAFRIPGFLSSPGGREFRGGPG
jgi:predicted ATPase